MISAWRNFKIIFSRPLFIIIFRPKTLFFVTYSILTGATKVEFVIYDLLSRWSKKVKKLSTQYVNDPIDRSPGAIHVVFVYRRLKTSCINHGSVKGNDSEPDIHKIQRYGTAAQRAKFAKKVHKPPLRVNVINFDGECFASFLPKSGGGRSAPRSDGPVFCIAHHVLKKVAFYLNDIIFQNKVHIIHCIVGLPCLKMITKPQITGMLILKAS